MNAMEMVLIWGVKAYPFSVSREDELWKEHGWSINLLLDGIHPTFEGREILAIKGEETWKRAQSCSVLHCNSSFGSD